MATPLDSPLTFTNVGKAKWWRSGFFASQTGYVLLALVTLFVVMNFASPYFLTQSNLQNVAKNFSFIAIATLGVTFVIITGGIDLSVGSVMCFSAMITSRVMTSISTPGMPGAEWFVHLADDGKTVIANVPGLILLISVLAGLGVALLIVTAIDGIGIGGNNLTLRADLLPETAVVKLAPKAMPAGVIDVLNIDKNSYLLLGAHQ